MNRLWRGILAVALVTPSCGGQLYWLEPCEDCKPASERPCTIANPQGTCPEGRVCCAGVCDTSCDAWSCSCEVDQACVDGRCEDTTCAPNNPNGDCPIGEACVGGDCIPIGVPCGCAGNLACVDGECVEIPAQEACSSENLRGLCPDGQICLGGECFTITNGCSVANPTGLCPSGATCIDGYCVPTADNPCGPGNADGYCPSCEQCVSPGVCELLSCSLSAPNCACEDPGDHCAAGSCECLPCSVGHPFGCCDDPDSICSIAGLCIPTGECRHPDDCSIPGTFCSCDDLCINNGTCLCDTDCDTFFVCNTELSVCERNLACPNGDADCPRTEFCDSTGQCRPDGTCAVDDDCFGTGEFCTSCGQCRPAGACCSDADCPGQFCSSASTCLNDGACIGRSDCPPGYACNSNLCELGLDACTANGGAACVPAGDDYFWCCPTGDPEDCCIQGQRCSADGTCILDGQCIDDIDCYAPHFTCVEFECEPVNPCPCGAGQACSAAGGCIPDDGSCVDDEDCSDGEVCSALFACEPATACGNQRFEATLVPPNMLIVLDRSGSMRDCVPPSSESRWNVARDALTSVVNANADTIRFGLSTYPLYCPGSTVCSIDSCWDDVGGVCDPSAPCHCSNDCDWTNICTNIAQQQVCEVYPPCRWQAGSCEVWDAAIGTGNNRMPGDVDVSVGNQPLAVLDGLAPPTGARGLQHPGGYTPTGRTLRNIASQLGAFGLPDATDEEDRDNYIMLVTDGEANSPGGTYGDVCNGLTSSEADDPMPPIECALDTLRAQEPPVRTFAVGFIGTARAQMNCMAVHGGTSRCATPDQCASITDAGECAGALTCSWSSGSCSGGVDASNCDAATEECYFRANNAQELNDAFVAIAGEVASCTYGLDAVPPSSNALYVYFHHHCSDITAFAACAAHEGCTWESSACVGEPIRLDRDATHGWDYQSATNQIVFAGQSCDRIKADEVTPVVILPCCSGEGC